MHKNSKNVHTVSIYICVCVCVCVCVCDVKICKVINYMASNYIFHILIY
jgi:hypothetical protein